MRGLIQRVQHANVTVNGDVVGAISAGLLLLLGIEKDDDHAKADKLLEKVLKYRVFNDDRGKMNLGLLEVAGELLIVSQFTLVADTRKGLRPGFSSCASPEYSKDLYEYFVVCANRLHDKVVTGQFGADMKVSLLNDGPVTFMLKA
ncbi:MAG: D-aminoacyl-tRNA deacylase [Candidatus Endonucleobacter bathymodioli]|uniref:D-aminoacyl-tRNA deacylase n=1 Tax=Candidatus Endonucleibacter bathymodioli TaxID=539814 RepID=A0AA90NU25_9GAMM|nr:D-aminoacyl-tRNA deacylase [Candidatus Endonucleobacter bathymodioli]